MCSDINALMQNQTSKPNGEVDKLDSFLLVRDLNYPNLTQPNQKRTPSFDIKLSTLLH